MYMYHLEAHKTFHWYDNSTQKRSINNHPKQENLKNEFNYWKQTLKIICNTLQYLNQIN